MAILARAVIVSHPRVDVVLRVQVVAAMANAALEAILETHVLYVSTGTNLVAHADACHDLIPRRRVVRLGVSDDAVEVVGSRVAMGTRAVTGSGAAHDVITHGTWPVETILFWRNQWLAARSIPVEDTGFSLVWGILGS